MGDLSNPGVKAMVMGPAIEAHIGLAFLSKKVKSLLDRQALSGQAVQAAGFSDRGEPFDPERPSCQADSPVFFILCGSQTFFYNPQRKLTRSWPVGDLLLGNYLDLLSNYSICAADGLGFAGTSVAVQSVRESSVVAGWAAKLGKGVARCGTL